MTPMHRSPTSSTHQPPSDPHPPAARRARQLSSTTAVLALALLLAGCDVLGLDLGGSGDDGPCSPGCVPGAVCVEGECVWDRDDRNGDAGTTPSSPDAEIARDAGAGFDAEPMADTATVDAATGDTESRGDAPDDMGMSDVSPVDTAAPDAGGATGDLWLDFGTEGTARGIGLSEDGFALCGYDDVYTVDLEGDTSFEIPDDPWPSEPVPGDPRRCGNDAETYLWRLLNCERISLGLEPLLCDLRLVWVAREHSLDMMQRDFFSHDNPDGESSFDRMERHGIDPQASGENIAWYPDLLEAHWGWMDSDGHRANILRETFSHVGVGVASDGRMIWLTQNFIRPWAR